MSALNEVPRPRIVNLCLRCVVRPADVKGNGVVVSPTGMAHYGEDYGVTACGIDATGPRWWWPL